MRKKIKIIHQRGPGTKNGWGRGRDGIHQKAEIDLRAAWILFLHYHLYLPQVLLCTLQHYQKQK